MTTNEILAKQNVLSKVMFKNDDKELSRDLKVKLMGMRIKMSKVKKEFEEDLQEFIKGLSTDEYKDLINKQEKTEQEEIKLSKIMNKMNEDYSTYLQSRGNDEVNLDLALTEEDFEEIIDVNTINDIELNGSKFSAPDFLELIHELFVK